MNIHTNTRCHLKSDFVSIAEAFVMFLVEAIADTFVIFLELTILVNLNRYLIKFPSFFRLLLIKFPNFVDHPPHLKNQPEYLIFRANPLILKTNLNT